MKIVKNVLLLSVTFLAVGVMKGDICDDFFKCRESKGKACHNVLSTTSSSYQARYNECSVQSQFTCKQQYPCESKFPQVPSQTISAPSNKNDDTALPAGKR